ncbi:hypothetical protein SAMN04488107_1255 [Geodermatophilus saharensis]|uniref:Uncharacterized protein n=1 Tax=Geodermatophilus saharensis TaxID=1137994 RepID=A0A239BJI9_9ACTN|nr:hypothetical protein SAMN04488107_1255 [Geodermatophilus saharensis]
MGRLARTSCRVLGHTGAWTCLGGGCLRVRTCRRCGEVEQEQEHAWGEFEYLTADRCEQERRCRRCGRAEARVLHRWGPWQYVGPDSFLLKLQQVHTCRRCGVQEQTDFERAF